MTTGREIRIASSPTGFLRATHGGHGPLAWSGQIRVPHFQRDFRWTRQDVIRLFDSIVKRYPVGSLLLWRRPAPAQQLTLGALRIDAPQVDQALWVVDGQQRVSSLANALHPDGAQDPRFNLGYDVREDRIVNRAVTDDPYVIPLPIVFDLTKVLGWFATHPEVSDYRNRAFELTKHLRQFSIPAYQVVQDDTLVLRDIFDRMNNLRQAAKPGGDFFRAQCRPRVRC
ncbi:MAG: DUF262 domain-containing protein, partial [Pseudonocardiaceae bacterium]